MAVALFATSGAARADPYAAAVPPALRDVVRPLPDLRVAGPDPERRRMAFFIALARRWDAQHQFSDSPAWRSVRGWSEPGETALTWDEAALDETAARYPTRRGRESPADDLVASVARANTEPDFACRFPIRARALFDAGLVTERPAIERDGGCPRFEAWATPERVGSVELVFASPSWSSPASSAGHIFLRIRHAPDGPFVAASGERTLGHGVDLSEDGAEDNYVVRGLTGGYRATLLEASAYDRFLEYGAQEQRDLLVYALRLTPRERRYLLAELWRQHDAGLSVRYYFLSINCARITWDALRAALPDLPRNSDWYLHPHQVVSELLRSGRARPLGVVPSQRTRARGAEARQAELAEGLSDVPGFTALHDARFGSISERTAALTAFTRDLDLGRLEAAELDALARYVDATIDVETLAADTATGAADPSVTGPTLDAALELRRRLPPTETARLEPFPDYAITASASRTYDLSFGWDPSRRQLGLRFRRGVIDEQPGTQRAARLRPSARTEFLVSELDLRWDGEGLPRIERSRVSILRIDGFGHGVRTTDGWLGSRLGFGFGLALQSTPFSQDRTTGLEIGAGPRLTLLADEAFSDYLVVGVELHLEGWLGADDPVRAAVDGVLELGFGIGGRHRFRLTARASPYLAPDGPGLAAEIVGRLELVGDPKSGFTLSPFGRWRYGEVLGDAAEIGVSASW